MTTPPYDGPENPLTLLSNDELLANQLSIALLCLRSKGALRRKHASHACALMSVLQFEGDRRGIKNVQKPYKA